MGKHFQITVMVGDQVQLDGETVEALLDNIRREGRLWSKVFPKGVANPYSGTVLRPNYSALVAEVTDFPFVSGPLAISAWRDMAIFPPMNSAEGRALKLYANTALAFAIVAFLWSEAGWLDESDGTNFADEVAQTVGEMLVKSVRLGSAF